MWTRARTETFFKRAADDAEDAFKEVGDSIQEAFSGVGDSFHKLTMRQPHWFSSANRGGGLANAFGQQGSPVGGLTDAFGRQVSPGKAAVGLAGSQDATAHQPPPEHPPPHVAAGVAGTSPLGGHKPGVLKAAPAPPAPPAPAERAAWPAQGGQDDDAMRRHCASLERLVVDLGISPQAARVALRHLDAWLVSDAGAMEMAAAEAAAHGSREDILHVGERVRLEGMLKNKDLNGMQGTLQCYAADSQRWKVVLPGNREYWVKPKLVKPLEPRRLPLPEASTDGNPSPAEEALAKRDVEQATSLAAGWALLEARQERLKAELQTREIMLLEREESLRKVQEALEAEQLRLGKAHHHDAAEQARGPAEIDRHLASVRGRGETLESASFSLDDDVEDVCGADQGEELELISTAEGSVRSMGLDETEEAEEADEVWDMDWSTLGTDRAGQPEDAVR